MQRVDLAAFWGGAGGAGGAGAGANEGRSRKKNPNVGIGLTLLGLKQAYAQGEGDLSRDVSILGLGSLSNYLKLKIVGKFKATPSLFRIFQRPMQRKAPYPSWFLGKGTTMWKQQIGGFLGRITRSFVHEKYFKNGVSTALLALFRLTRGIRQ